jgi:hypothetical protein
MPQSSGKHNFDAQHLSAYTLNSYALICSDSQAACTSAILASMLKLGIRTPYAIRVSQLVVSRDNLG